MSFYRTAYLENGNPVNIVIDDDAKREWTWNGKSVAYIDMPVDLQNQLDDLMDIFEDGDNSFDGEYEFYPYGEFYIRRRASIVEPVN